jgi:hypothetical protein
MDERQLYRGIHGSYHWLTSTEDYSGTLLRVCPEIVLGRYVAVTSTDSGILRLSEAERASGWHSRQGIAYSPKIGFAADIPHQVDGPDAPGYDEFYVFENPCELGERSQGNLFLEEFAPAPGRTIVFVNWAAFQLHDPDPAVQALVSLFWPQLERIQPESYIADGQDCLTFVSRRPELVDCLQERLASAPPNPQASA